jgi:ribose 5-phosphate isomerase A
MFDFKLLEQKAAQARALVGADRKPSPLPGEAVERGQRAWVGPAFAGDIRLIMRQELGEHSVHVALRADPRQRLLDHDPGAVANAAADGLDRNRCESATHEHIVKSVGQVRRGIDQRAVEIEDDGGAGEHGSTLSHAPCGLASGGVEGLLRAARGEGLLSKTDELKEAAARAALDLVSEGMRLGLGTGSTASRFVAALGERVAQGLNVLCVPTSEATREQAVKLGIPITTLDETPRLDLTIDGADEIDLELRMIKGGGGALLREKIVATASDRMVVVADESKLVSVLGAFSLPVEVVRFGLMATIGLIEAIAAEAGCHGAITLRPGQGEAPFVTDQGNLILDCAFGSIPEPEVLAFSLKRVPGVIEHGLFLGLADLAIVAGNSGVRALRRAGA